MFADQNFYYPFIKKHYLMFIVLFLCISSFLSLIILKGKVKVYDEIVGMVEDDNIICVVPLKVLEHLSTHHEIIINRKTYSYQILEITSDISVNDNIIYKQVILDIPIEDNIRREHNTFTMIIPIEEVNLLQIIKTIIKEE